MGTRIWAVAIALLVVLPASGCGLVLSKDAVISAPPAQPPPASGGASANGASGGFSRTNVPTHASRPLPRWCGLAPTCAPTYPTAGSVPTTVVAASPEYCAALGKAVTSGYDVFSLRTETSVSKIKQKLRAAVADLESFAAVAHDPEIDAVLAKDGLGLKDLDQFQEGQAPALLEYLVPRASQLSLLIQRIINRAVCPDL